MRGSDIAALTHIYQPLRTAGGQGVSYTACHAPGMHAGPQLARCAHPGGNAEGRHERKLLNHGVACSHALLVKRKTNTMSILPNCQLQIARFDFTWGSQVRRRCAPMCTARDADALVACSFR